MANLGLVPWLNESDRGHWRNSRAGRVFTLHAAHLSLIPGITYGSPNPPGLISEYELGIILEVGWM